MCRLRKPYRMIDTKMKENGEMKLRRWWSLASKTKQSVGKNRPRQRCRIWFQSLSTSDRSTIIGVDREWLESTLQFASRRKTNMRVSRPSDIINSRCVRLLIPVLIVFLSSCRAHPLQQRRRSEKGGRGQLKKTSYYALRSRKVSRSDCLGGKSIAPAPWSFGLHRAR